MTTELAVLAETLSYVILKNPKYPKYREPGASSVAALPDVRKSFLLAFFVQFLCFFVRCLLILKWDAQTLEGLVNI